MRQKERYGTISAVPAGSGVSGAAEREGRVGGRPSVFLHPSGSGAYGPKEFRAGLWGRRWSVVLSGADAEGVVVRLRGGDHVGAAAGAAHPGRSGIALSGGRSAARQLGAERVSAAACAGLNDVFTQVLEMAREMKLGRLGQVAIDSTRIQAAASRHRLETEERLRQERSRLRRSIRQWQKLCDEEDPNEGAGTRLHVERLQERLQAMPRRLEKLRKSGMKKLSRTDPEARFLRERSGFALGYTAEAA